MKFSLAIWNTSRSLGKFQHRLFSQIPSNTVVIHALNFEHFHCRYVTAHIWACPPSEGDDYIFHCHPADQKIPKPKRLQEWYRKMLDKAFAERILHDYKVWQRPYDLLKTLINLFLFYKSVFDCVYAIKYLSIWYK